MEKKIKKFEELLDKNTVLLKNKIDSELAKLHSKRQKQFNMLNIKYNKCKMLIGTINAQEMIQQKHNKKFFMIRNDVPKVKFSEMDQIDNFNLNLKSQETLNPKIKEDDILIDDEAS